MRDEKEPKFTKRFEKTFGSEKSEYKKRLVKGGPKANFKSPKLKFKAGKANRLHNPLKK